MGAKWVAVGAIVAVVAVGASMGKREHRISTERRHSAYLFGDTRQMLAWAEQGDREAQYFLGHALTQKFRESRGTDTASCEKGVEWLRKAAAQDVPGAKMELARMQYDGECMEADQVQALVAALALANEGFAPAQTFIGSYFASRNGPDPSPNGAVVPAELATTGSSRDREEKSAAWYIKAAEQGYEPAIRNLAGSGARMPRDPERAAYWRDKLEERRHLAQTEEQVAHERAGLRSD